MTWLLALTLALGPSDYTIDLRRTDLKKARLELPGSRRAELAGWALFGLGAGLDYYTTKRGLESGFVETNPFAEDMYDWRGSTGLVVQKAAVTGLMYLITRPIKNRTARAFLLGLGGGLQLAAANHNHELRK